MKGTTIKMIDSNMKFYEAPVKELREDFVYSLIQSGQMSVQQFTAWVEAVRDEWFLVGMKTATQNQHEIIENEDNSTISPQAISSSIEFF